MAEAAEVTGQDASLDSVHVDVLVRAHKKVCYYGQFSPYLTHVAFKHSLSVYPLQAGEKSSTTVRIFEKNDFYYFFEKDAEFAAKLTYGSSTVNIVIVFSFRILVCV